MLFALCVCVLCACRKLADINEDNSLSEDEFCIAMKLVVARRKGLTIPSVLPDVLRPQPQPGEHHIPVCAVTVPTVAVGASLTLHTSVTLTTLCC